MKVTTSYEYNFDDSLNRIDEILNTSSTFKELEEIPSSDRLRYDNGFYLNCYAIFIDIRQSSKLPTKYNRPTLAKIYRAFISEITAIFQSYEDCKEINIVGDSVWAVFNSKKKNDVLNVFSAAYTSNSLVRTLNYKMSKKGIEPIEIGIGIAKGRALMIQAGYKGSGIKDIVWMGDVVNQASKMCSKANKIVSENLVITDSVFIDLNGYGNGKDNYQSFFKKINDFYVSDVIRIDLEDWLNKQIKYFFV